MPSYYFERALFIVGEQNSGKSTQLRSMFRDIRLGTDGIIPVATNLRDMYRLSNERCLYLRLTSPHERHEYIGRRPSEDADNFLDKTHERMLTNTPVVGRRWNFACPIQPHAANHMPDAVETISAFVGRFAPERTRVLFISPDRHGVSHEKLLLIDRLRVVPSVELPGLMLVSERRMA
jgi:hypothetical protein